MVELPRAGTPTSKETMLRQRLSNALRVLRANEEEVADLVRQIKACTNTVENTDVFTTYHDAELPTWRCNECNFEDSTPLLEVSSLGVCPRCERQAFAVVDATSTGVV